jgi:hypothetical protein
MADEWSDEETIKVVIENAFEHLIEGAFDRVGSESYK